MTRQLYNSDLSIRVHSSDFESPGADYIPILRVQTVIAAEFLNDFFFPIHLVS